MSEPKVFVLVDADGKPVDWTPPDWADLRARAAAKQAQREADAATRSDDIDERIAALQAQKATLASASKPMGRVQ